ncbi:isoprenylcysteine carboxylmethyltransferase family protein [Gallaecimonas sp. GXIMD4217]|uniref:methyltransferase family protein n=1 Tax=Gallaecimonas sp. GXIMD4217 TaxID=3131927 RepID=UPI00311B0ABC
MIKKAGPGIPYPPPLVLVLPFAAAVALDFYWPLAEGQASGIILLLAWLLLAGGAPLAFWGLLLFHRKKTAIFPNRAASTLVVEGPYRLSRNPMYLGLVLAYLGLALLLLNLWALLLLPPALWWFNKKIIAKEERYLKAKFGKAYEKYCKKVGRWL